MNELIIELTDISPRDFFGSQNENIDLLKKYFPKLKIVARGSKLKAYGDEELLEEFDKRFEMITTHFAKYNKLDENSIERILTSNSEADYASSPNSGEVLVHGVNGKLIKAQTVNQRKLVDAALKNDMVFAIGPAGTGNAKRKTSKTYYSNKTCSRSRGKFRVFTWRFTGKIGSIYATFV